MPAVHELQHLAAVPGDGPAAVRCVLHCTVQICYYTRIAYLFDHPGTVFYAVFMSFWGEQRKHSVFIQLSSQLL